MGWGVPCLTVVENSSQGILDKSELYRELEAPTQNRAWLTAVAYLIWFRKIKEQGNKYYTEPGVGLAFGYLYTGYIYFLVKQNIYGIIKVQYADMAPCTKVTLS